MGPTTMLSAPVDTLGRPLAEWWPRFVAFAIDSVIILVPKLILAAIALPRAHGSAFAADKVTLDVTLLALAWVVIDVLYFGFLNGGASGQTLGQRSLGIAVRDQGREGPIGFQRAALRTLVLNPTVLVTWIPVFWVLVGVYSFVAGLSPLWDQQHQGFHDKLEKTVVVKVR
jgi:uncharacterized RDD family membrane protein YckC